MSELLKEGDRAPEFTAPDQEGNEVSLADYRGKKVVLYFYPKDMTPGCTKEACNLRDNMDELQNKGYHVLGVSADGVERHKKFAEKHELPFRLIADPDKKVVNAYGVWGTKKFMGNTFDGILRTTFLIDESGIIERVIGKVKTKEHAQQILS